MAITALPTPPSRADQANFATQADAFLGALPQFGADLNVLCPLASSASDILAAASYKGLWTGLSGALAFPASTYHLGKFWTLKSSLADVTTKVPGTASEWVSQITDLNGGGLDSTSAVDVTLTSISARAQTINMTVTGKVVNLPAATTLTTGGPVFSIKNTGAEIFTVCDGSGVTVAVLDMGQSASFFLTDNTSTAGLWSVANTSVASWLAGVRKGISTVQNAVASTLIACVSLSSTQVLAIYRATAGYAYAVTLNIAGSTVTPGAIVAVTAISALDIAITKLSSSAALVTYIGASNYVESRVLTVSGTTVTSNAALVVNGAVSSVTSVTALSATQAVVTYLEGTTPNARTLNISGTTVTAGAAITFGAASSAAVVYALSATQAIACYAASNVLYCLTLNVSGTTVTSGSAASYSPGICTGVSVCMISATTALVTYIGTTNYVWAAVLTISGTTVSIGTPSQINSATSTTTSVRVMSATKAVVLYFLGATSTMAATIDLFGSKVIGGPSVLLSSDISYKSMDFLSIGKALVAWYGTSGYLTSSLLDVAK